MTLLTPWEQHRRFVRNFTEVNHRLNDFGWLVCGWISGGDLEELRIYLEGLIPSVGGFEKGAVSREIDGRLTELAFSPRLRAFQTFRARELPHAADVSHHLDRALLHYYCRDFFSATLCLLPAIEGLMLRHIGWTFGGNPKPHVDKVIAAIRARIPLIPAPEIQERHEAHKEVLIAFLERWIFRDLRTADLDVSHLNRNYVLHSMGEGDYYSASDCHRLFLLFDIYVDLLAYETGRSLYAFPPKGELSIDLRAAHYLALIAGKLSVGEKIQVEEQIMRANRYYHREDRPPDWDAIRLHRARKLVELIRAAKVRAVKDGAGGRP